jgi:hypothetical protein
MVESGLPCVARKVDLPVIQSLTTNHNKCNHSASSYIGEHPINIVPFFKGFLCQLTPTPKEMSFSDDSSRLDGFSPRPIFLLKHLGADRMFDAKCCFSLMKISIYKRNIIDPFPKF